MSTYTYREILNQVQRLTPEEQRQLLEDIAVMLRHQAKPRPKHNIMEFRGVGKETWQGVDVEKYIEEE